jgi:predicted molibdopterin-dependent oxidoreductase YjgC
VAVTMKNAVFWNVAPCGSCKELLRSVLGLIVTANVAPSSPILLTLMKEAIRSSEKSFLTRDPRRNLPEEGVLLLQKCL